MSVRMKPMQILCKLIGVAPYSFDPGSSKAKFKASMLGMIYSLSIGAFLTWFAFLNYKTTHLNLTSGSYVTIGAQWMQFYVNNGFSVLIIIANSLQQWKVVKVFNALYEARDHPQKISDQEQFSKDVLYGIAAVVVTIFLHLLTTLTSYFDNDKRIDYYWFPYGILFLLNALVVLQFLCAVVKVGEKFKALNFRLEDCISERRTVMAKYNNTEMIDAEVNKVAGEHLKLINETELLLSAFSHQLLICFVAALAISVSGLYLICKRIIQHAVDTSKLSVHQQREKHYNWWCLTCYPLLHSILIGFIISVCHWTTNKTASLAGTLLRIQRVFQFSESSSINGFCHQLLLQRISFNVFHLFTINPSIICSIITTVLTYLIILVQFEVSQDIEKTVILDPLNSGSGGPFNSSNDDDYSYSFQNLTEIE